jgi:7-keto-8-aminopelargonate synthetase-like enzyme
MTEPAPLQQIDRTYVKVGKRKLSYFSGCDYYRLASHPRVLKALRKGLKKYGLNVASSRVTTGNHVLYQQLERALASFFHTEMALLVPNGYLTNLIVAQTLSRNFSHALLDEKSHTSLCDAARLLDCPVMRFKHCDPQDLKHTAARCGPGAKVMVLTDGMFSHDGSTAPLAAYLRVLPADAVILVDDAHGAGVLGKSGRGSVEHAGVDSGRIIQNITLSKAFGVFGGAVMGSHALRQQIFERSHLFIGSTPLPLPLAAAALESVSLFRTDKRLKQRLIRNTHYVKTALLKRGFPISDAPGPILPLLANSETEALRVKRALLAAGIFPPFVRYPNGPKNGYFRFVLSSEHTRNQLDALIAVLSKNCSLP